MPAEQRRTTFAYLLDPVFLAAVGAYLINQFLIKSYLRMYRGYYSPFFHGHFNDCLLVPVALPVFLLVYRWLRLRPDDAPPRWWEVVLHLLVWSIFFKWFGPVVLHSGVADPFDLVAYFGGGLVAWLLWQRHALTRNKTPASNHNVNVLS